MDDVDLFARLRSITIIKGVEWPNKLRAYMDNGARMSGVYAILKGLGPAVADEDADELSEILMENYGSWVIDENISRRAVEDWMIQMQFNRSILKQVNTVTSDDIETYMGWCKEISTSDPVGQVILADRLFKVVEVAQEQRIGFRNLLESGIFQKMFTSMFRNFNEHKFNKSVDVLVHLTKTSKVECRYTLGALTSLQRLLEVHKNLYRGKSASVDSFKVLVDDMERNCPSN